MRLRSRHVYYQDRTVWFVFHCLSGSYITTSMVPLGQRFLFDQGEPPWGSVNSELRLIS